MRILCTTGEVRALISAARQSRKTVGFVPTMGALHEGHGALIAAAKAANDVVIVSIFVNPLQFNDVNDLANYPTTTLSDEEMCSRRAVDAIFRPDVSEVYPEGFDTTVVPGALAASHEGVHRPGHFTGMATVVLKLLNMVLADDAYFGRKDFQQFAIVRRMVADFNHPTKIHGVSTVREPDGLAMSSRNVKLSPNARASATRISAALMAAQESIRQGVSTSQSIDDARRHLAADDAIEIEYFDAVDVDTLTLPGNIDHVDPSRLVLLVAVKIDGVRLIDNIELDPRKDP